MGRRRFGAADLGRFGLGLKTASLSQGRSLTVITRKGSAPPLSRRWDLDHIRRAKRWELISRLSDQGDDLQRRVANMDHGTAVLIEKLDRSGLTAESDDAPRVIGPTLKAVSDHLSMVFHRFIERGLEIVVGPTALAPWDPFLSSKSTLLPAESLRLGQRALQVTPYVLPHNSKLTDAEHAAAAGPRGWNAHQGFYIYRCERLIVPGTWLNLGFKKEEHFKLARISVDLPNTMDSEWHLNVIKSHVAAPSYLKDDFSRIAHEVRHSASEVYRSRGERQLPLKTQPERFVWRREQTRAGARFRIDRTHPLIQALLSSGCEHDALLERVIQMIEQRLPVMAILQEPAKTLDGSNDSA